MEIRRNTRTLLLVVAVAILACAALTHAAAAADSGASATSAAAAAVEDEVELDVLPDIPSPPAASSSDPTRPPSKNAEPISLNRADFCRACYSVVEEFHKCQPTERRRKERGASQRASASACMSTAADMLRSLSISLRVSLVRDRSQLQRPVCSSQHDDVARRVGRVVLSHGRVRALEGAAPLGVHQDGAGPPRRGAGALPRHAHLARVHHAGTSLPTQDRGRRDRHTSTRAKVARFENSSDAILMFSLLPSFSLAPVMCEDRCMRRVGA